jgi:hypothetical protein
MEESENNFQKNFIEVQIHLLVPLILGWLVIKSEKNLYSEHDSNPVYYFLAIILKIGVALWLLISIMRFSHYMYKKVQNG